ncbi:MAG: pilus assembly protein N-terminal domain-containing protein, partial [Planctomycetota bacterium]
MALVAGIATTTMLSPVSAQDAGDAPEADTLASAPASLDFSDFKITQPIEEMQLMVKSSRILTLDGVIPKFQVFDENVLGTTPISANQVMITARKPGITEMKLWDADNKAYTVNVVVTADSRELEGMLRSQLPYASLSVAVLDTAAIVSGTVSNVDDVDRALAIAEQYYPTIINNIRVVGVQQVLLHTRILEVSRTKLRQFGIDWSLGSLTGSDGIVIGPGQTIDTSATAAFNTPSAITGTGLTNVRTRFNLGSHQFNGLIKALRQNNLIKVLAEPTVVATHGRPAQFLVGGKVPYIVPSLQGPSVNFEQFGTKVDFLPFVIGPGRVRLEVRPEVSEPDPSRGVTVSGGSVPGFRERSIETAVEMQAGQTFAIAGLIQTRVEAQSQAIPLLGEMPYIGSLFRAVSEQTNEIELLVTVTPELVEAMDPHEVPAGGPGLNTDSPTDHEFYWYGHLETPTMKGEGMGGPGCDSGMLSGFNGGHAQPVNGAQMRS